jgi:hypothetical protein
VNIILAGLYKRKFGGMYVGQAVGIVAVAVLAPGGCRVGRDRSGLWLP